MICLISIVTAETNYHLLSNRESEGAENRNPRLYPYLTTRFLFSVVLFVHTQHLLLHRRVMSVRSNSWADLYLN